MKRKNIELSLEKLAGGFPHVILSFAISLPFRHHELCSQHLYVIPSEHSTPIHVIPSECSTPSTSSRASAASRGI